MQYYYFYFYRKNAEDVTVHAGSVLLDKDKVVYDAEKLIVNRNYNPFKLTDDIALVYVSKDIVFNELVQPVALPSNNNVKSGDLVVLTGWGRLYVSNQ